MKAADGGRSPRGWRGSAGRCPTLALLALLGCIHPLALVPGLECFQTPGGHLPGTSVDSLDANQMSAYLRSLGEPVLWRTQNSPTPTIRFSLAGYASRPVAIRVERQDERTARIHASRLRSTRCPSRVALLDRGQREEASRAISIEQWDAVATLFRDADLDRAGMLDPLPRGTDSDEVLVTTDGNRYLVEYRDRRGYRAVLRHSSSPLVRSPGFARLCAQIVALSPLPFENEASTACPDPGPQDLPSRQE
jgi:hypothetical protein